VNNPTGFVDIHCHLLPGLDDGPCTWDEAVSLAELAAAEGISTIVATPHQLGVHARNHGDAIRRTTARLQNLLAARKIPVRVLPGAEIHVEAALAARIHSGQLLSLADRRRHVLVEMPSAVFLPLDRLLAELSGAGMVTVLAHPERIAQAIAEPDLLEALVDQGCLLQVTAGSLTGCSGSRIRGLAESLVRKGLVHFVSTDAHEPGPRARTMRAAFRHVARLAGEETARALCCHNPARVAAGQPVPQGRREPVKPVWTRWFRRSKVA
jgi:protein-tyrosine phosphatase